MKSIKNKNRVLGLIILILLVCPKPAFAVKAYVPFYAEVAAAPNVLLQLDTSTSMQWGVDGTSQGEPRKIDVLRRVLTGAGRIPIMYDYNGTNYQVYHGQVGGELSVYQELADQGLFIDVLVMRYNNSSSNYELVSSDTTYKTMLTSHETAYFTFKTYHDNPLQAAKPSLFPMIASATYPFHKFLRDHNAETFTLVDTRDIVDYGFTLNRPIYRAGGAGALAFKDDFVRNYGQYDNLKITRVKYIPATGTGCYKIVNKKYACYKPAPFPIIPPDPDLSLTTFVIWDAEDFTYNLAGMSNASMRLYDFIAYLKSNGVVANNYNSFLTDTTNQTVCGDGPSFLVCPSDGKGARDVFRIAQDGTAASTKVIPRTYNPAVSADVQAVADRIGNHIPIVMEVEDAVTAGTVLHEFIKVAGTDNEGQSVRDGLGYSAKTWSADSLDDPSFDGFFDNNSGIFTGLPYTAMAIDSYGIMDNYKDKVRFALMVADKNTDEDFPQSSQPDGRGSILDYNFPDKDYEATGVEGLERHNNDLQELISQQDLNEDGVSPPPNDKMTDPNGVSILPWFLRDVVSYLYAVWFTDYNNPRTGGYLFDAQYDPTPFHDPTSYDPTSGMYNHWDTTGMPDFNGHILLNDPYYYNRCRSNNVILVTDGRQSGGMQAGTARRLERDYEWLLKAPKNWLAPAVQPAQGWKPTKLYVLAFLDAEAMKDNPPNKEAIAQLEWVAAKSSLALLEGATDPTLTACANADPEEICEPVLATNEAELTAAFTRIIDAILKGSYSRSAPVVNTNLSKGAAGYFDIAPNEEPLWMGHLVWADLAPLQELKEGSTTIEPESDAADVLNARDSSTREIFTSEYNDSTNEWDRVNFVSGSAATLVDYLFPLYPNYNAAFDQNGDNALTTTDAGILIDFVRAEDGSTYKLKDEKGHPIVRDWKLGAIFRSTPICAGKPPKEIFENDSTYQAYADHYANTPEIIYVGALDGMLHAFFFDDLDGDTGPRSALEEAYAYVPNYLLNTLWHLRLGEQEVYVDGDPNVAVMKVADTGVSDGDTWCNEDEGWCWQEILYGGLRDGGPAYFSLNVTDTNTVQGQAGDSVTIRWEFTDPDKEGVFDSILGNSWSLPYIDELLYQPQDAGTVMDTRVAMIFGGGTSPSGKPYEGSWLYFLDADLGTPIPNLLDADSTTPVQTILVPSIDQNCDLAPGELLTAENYADNCDLTVNNTNQVPSDILMLDVDRDGFPDWGYFGDMQGRVWKINVYNHDPAEWGICLFFDSGDTGYDDLSNPEADCDGDLRDYEADEQPDCVDPDKRRPFFYRPDLAKFYQQWMIYIGTGHIEYESEVQDETIRNYVFALLDEDNLDECSYATIWPGVYEAGESGWPIQLGVNEKLLSSPLAILSEDNRYGAEVTFQTFVPTETTNPCSPGTSYTWRVDYNSGRGAILSTGDLVRKIAETGFVGKTLTLGNMKLTFNPSREPPGFPGQKIDIDPFRGYYYWWIK